MAEILVIRHGQTEWSADGRHTSVTDLPLTADGEAQAARLRPAVAGRTFAAVLCSPRARATRTAEIAGLAITAIDEDLAEWRYGDYEGITSAQIRERDPNWDLWRDGCPGGEQPDEVGARLDRVLDRARSYLDADADDGDVVLIGHGHSSRVATARWLGQPVAAGALYLLDTATISAFGFEHGRPVLHRWNERPVARRALGDDPS
ncbi:MAG TPA: histidine phosphatase family protein [Micromonosporaceae bacterium]|jgi:probable phosphoglycerate mutase|nr:histidine phosphatase family protein [Micromonosporaceae bacterium]